ncbi:Uncharacterised protein [Mycobacteroides abscessus subsp. abscessus]|nr:Uncharacterised protein [Mycobacteroides abscessus subsp. abscessus]
MHQGAVGDQSVFGDAGAPSGGLFTGVEPGGDGGQPRVTGDQPDQAFGLVVGQGVHRVKDQRLHSGDAGFPGAQHMIEDRVEERLGLTRAGPGGHQCRLRPVPMFGRQPFKRAGLMAVRHEMLGPPVQLLGPLGTGRGERQPQAHVGPLEHPRLGVPDEVGERGLRVGIGQRECRCEIVGQAFAQMLGLQSREKSAHQKSLIMAPFGT